MILEERRFHEQTLMSSRPSLLAGRIRPRLLLIPVLDRRASPHPLRQPLTLWELRKLRLLFKLLLARCKKKGGAPRFFLRRRRLKENRGQVPIKRLLLQTVVLIPSATHARSSLSETQHSWNGMDERLVRAISRLVRDPAECAPQLPLVIHVEFQQA
jgi:hypothetical protein